MKEFNIFDYIGEEYQLISEIKSGNNSKLFLLYDKTCGRKVLLKSGRTDLIENEAHNISRLSGEGIPEVYHCFEHEGTAYLLRQYIEGRTLRKCLEADGVFTLKKTVEIGIAVCKVISRFHKCDPPIIHRDIKSDNIILTNDGEVYIIDLGISREFNSVASRDTIVMGTPSAAPPEQFGYSQTDVRSDVYSMGVLLHEMVTGEIILDKGRTSRKISRIIKKCTMFSPDDRYHSIDNLRKALEKLLFRRKYIIKVAAICTALLIVFVFSKSWILKTNISKIDNIDENVTSEPETVYFVKLSDYYLGDYEYSENIPRSLLENFDGDIKLTIKVEVGNLWPYANFAVIAFMGENAEVKSLIEEMKCSYEQNVDGFIALDEFVERENKQTECEFIISHDAISKFHQKGIAFQAINVTVKYALLSDA